MAAGAGEASSLALGLLFGVAKLVKDVHDQNNRARRCKAINADRVADDRIKVTIVRQKSAKRNLSFDMIFDLKPKYRNALRQHLITNDRKAALATNDILQRNRNLFYQHLGLWGRIKPSDLENILQSIESLARQFGISDKIMISVNDGHIQEGYYIVDQANQNSLPVLGWRNTQQFNGINFEGISIREAESRINDMPKFYLELLHVRTNIDDGLLNKIACQQLIESAETQIIETALLGKIMTTGSDSKFKYALDKMVKNWCERGFKCSIAENDNRGANSPDYTITFRGVSNYYENFKGILFKDTNIPAVKEEFLSDAEKVTNELANNIIKLINARRSSVSLPKS